jgi:hypothetical protein
MININHHPSSTLPPSLPLSSPLYHHHHCMHTHHHHSYALSTITTTLKQASWMERGPK